MKRVPVFLLCLALILSLMGCGSDTDTSDISFAKEDFSQVHSAVLRNLHNGKGTYISNVDDIDVLCGLLRSVRGKEGRSSKGYYEGSYELRLYANESATKAVMQEEVPLFSIGFGDTAVFNFGVGEDGYPVRYTLKGISIEEVIDTLSRFDLS